MFVNLPLALAFAWVVSWFYKPAFEACVIVGYWLTNILGFILLHKGAEKMISEKGKPYSRRALGRDIAVSLLYTGLIVILLKLKVLAPLTDYLHRK